MKIIPLSQYIYIMSKLKLILKFQIKGITILLSLFIFTSQFSPPLLADGQAWLNNSLSLKVTSDFSLKFTNETRYDEITFMSPYLKNIQGGIVYKLPENFYLSLLYKRENTEYSYFTLSENRFTLESGWKTKFASHYDFDCRFRIEIRNYDKKLAKNHLRFRFRIRIVASFQIGSLKIKPFIATEPFGDTKEDSINRNRFYLGSVFPLSEKVEFVLNYIRQDTKNKETIHIINSGINLKF